MEISFVLAASLWSMFYSGKTQEASSLCSLHLLFKIVLIKLSEKIRSHWSTIILAAKSSLSGGGEICQLKFGDCMNFFFFFFFFACKIDRACWLFLFYLACHCDDIDAVVCVCVCVYVCAHGFNCAHLPAPPSVVQHQAKARAEPGSVRRVLSLPYSWAFSSTSGKNLSEQTECIHIRDVLAYQSDCMPSNGDSAGKSMASLLVQSVNILFILCDWGREMLN